MNCFLDRQPNDPTDYLKTAGKLQYSDFTNIQAYAWINAHKKGPGDTGPFFSQLSNA